ncbi:MAG: hypothetical protein IIA67_00385 [Planctomycetes bacterium]|nr:hypothetical protein [Planctomycetota bacterium]
MNITSDHAQSSVYDDSNWSDDEMSALAADMFDGLDNPQEVESSPTSAPRPVLQRKPAKAGSTKGVGISAIHQLKLVADGRAG